MKQLLRLFFHHLYHAFAWAYDLVSALVSVGRWQDWVMTALPYIKGPSVLEIGYGPGHLQVAMRKRGLAVFGLDESRQMGRMAFSRLTGFGLPVALVRGQGQCLPFGSDCFDNVVATFPSEYIFALETLEEIRRVLRPGGRLVIVPMASISGNNPSDSAAAWLFRITKQGGEITESIKERIKVPFMAAGFEVRVETVEQHSSTVLVIVAEKPIR